MIEGAAISGGSAHCTRRPFGPRPSASRLQRKSLMYSQYPMMLDTAARLTM